MVAVILLTRSFVVAALAKRMHARCDKKLFAIADVELTKVAAEV
jgi:hypothetical protein